MKLFFTELAAYVNGHKGYYAKVIGDCIEIKKTGVETIYLTNTYKETRKVLGYEK